MCLSALTLVPDSLDAGRTVIDRELAAQMDRGLPADGTRVIVKLRGDDLPAYGALRRAGVRARQDRALSGVAPGAYQMRHRYKNLSGFAMRAGRSALRALENHPDVERIYLDGTVRGQLVEANDLIGGTMTTLQGFTGAGVNVAVLDSGIDTDHPFLSNDLIHERCYCSGGSGCCPGGGSVETGPGSAEDDAGHGTAVAGIVTSHWSIRPGLAQDAGIVAIKVLDSSASGSFSDFDQALDWLVSNHAAFGVRVVNMSLGDTQEWTNPASFPCTGSLTATAINSLTTAGVTVVASSGNDGFDSGVIFPACSPNAISVGGVYDANHGSVSWAACTDTTSFADRFVCHTNSGPSGLLDVLAPDWRIDTTGLSGGSNSFSGTSAAAPFISAMAALLYANNPSLTPFNVRSLIISHGPLVPDPAAPANMWRRVAPAEIMTTAIGGPDTDLDGISDDGDGSGTAGDNPCVDGATLLCDDNCAFRANPTQDDPGGVGAASPPNGIGTDCECGDLDASGFVDSSDVAALRLNLADPNGAPLPVDVNERCSVIGTSTSCGLIEAAVIMRNVDNPLLAPLIAPVCNAAIGL